MMKLRHGIFSTMLASLLVIGLSACEEPGPAEKAGKAIDDTASNIADQATETKEAIEKKMDEE